MKKRMAAVLPVFVLGCATTMLPYQVTTDVDRSVTFDDIRKDPEALSGKKIVLGGEIIQARALKEGTEMEILQKPLDYYDVPLVTDESHGRFLVTFKEFLDPQVFKEGRRITIVGEVKGKKVLPLGGTEYAYPSIAGRYVQLWPQRQEEYYYPQFQFGIGVYRWYPYWW